MKELRIQSKGHPLRAFFAFDPERKGVLLCAGNKVGDEKRFYKRMIPIADKEYEIHLKKRGYCYGKNAARYNGKRKA